MPDHAALCIRVMERFFEEVYADPELRGLMARTNIDIDLRWIFREVLEEQLGPHAFSGKPPLRVRRPRGCAGS